MKDLLLYPVGSTPACRYAADFLKQAGLSLTDHPSPEVSHLLLDVPSFAPDGSLRGGGDVHSLLRMLPEDICIVGGNLNQPALDGKRCMDLLKDEAYLAKNAAITAECALRVAYPRIDYVLEGAPCLVIGWGRIGKCLGRLLKALGTEVTIAARKESDRAMIQALGYEAVEISRLAEHLPKFRLVFNTAPEPVLNSGQLSLCPGCVKIELASKTGLEGEDVVIARGLPGGYAPESSGRLIAQTFLRLCKCNP